MKESKSKGANPLKGVFAIVDLIGWGLAAMLAIFAIGAKKYDPWDGEK